MSQIEVGFGSVIGDENLAVLNGIHCAGVNIKIWVEFLSGNFKTARFQKSAEGCRSDSLAESGNYTSGDKNIL